MNFDEAFTRLLGHEGSYSNNPADPGGETMWGVTLKVARANGYTGPMRDLPQSVAKSIYWKSYWDAVKADQMPDIARFDLFDAAVNSGPKQAIKWLQAAVGVPEDGAIGPMTMAAVAKATPLAVARFNGIRLAFMADLPTWASFGKGWARRIAGNLKALA